MSHHAPYRLELAYVGLESPDPAAMARYLGEVVGLMPGPQRADGGTTWRNDHKAWRLWVQPGPRKDAVCVGFEALDETAIPPHLVTLELRPRECWGEYPGVSLEVTDARTGRAPPGRGRARVTDGRFTQRLDGPHVQTDGHDPALHAGFAGAYGRPGTYRVEVRWPGYRPWVREDVVARPHVCSVVPARVAVKLHPLP